MEPKPICVTIFGENLQDEDLQVVLDRLVMEADSRNATFCEPPPLPPAEMGGDAASFIDLQRGRGRARVTHYPGRHPHTSTPGVFTRLDCLIQERVD